MLRGTLDDFTLPDVFRLVSGAKRTGELAVSRSAGSGRVLFRAGEVYFAESSLAREPLGQKLVRARAVTEGQLMKALDEAAAGGGRVGEILVASGVVDVEQLQAAVREQIEDSVFDLLRWELGEFEWTPGTEVDVEVPIAVSVENLIMEASRRLDELEVIKRKIPSTESVLRMVATPPEGAVEINITPEEWRILVLVDGSRSVGEIAAAVSLDELGALRVLYGLVAAGLIELAGDREPVARELPPAAPELDDSEPDLDVAAEAAAFVAASDETMPDLEAGVDLADIAAPLLDEPLIAVESFDAPADEELVATVPPEMPEAPPAATEAELAEPSIDRAAAVRELAGLFGDDDRARPQRAAAETPAHPQRLEDDDQITKGLISRLIDGVKGL